MPTWRCSRNGACEDEGEVGGCRASAPTLRAISYAGTVSTNPESAAGNRPTLGLSAAGPLRSERQPSFYEAIGGEATFRRIVHRFYEQVAGDDLLRPMYPDADLGPAEDRLRMFLEQYWGGPTTYSETRGHPRLRMRHAPFRVSPAARDRWLDFMRVAVDEADLAPIHRATLWDYLERAAHSLVNTFEEE